MLAETKTRNGWMNSGCREIIGEIPKRLESEGWDSVRPAISITVRGWLMRAFLEDKLKGAVETALEFYTSALELLQRGSNTFADVDAKERGAVFEPTLIRSIKGLRLDSLMGVYLKHPGPSSKFMLDEMLAGADELLAEIGEIPDAPTLQDVWFFLAYYSYPAGQAHAVRGFHYQHTGKLLQNTQGLTREVRELYKKAASEYLETLKYYPPDDQYNACESCIRGYSVGEPLHNTSGYAHCAFNCLRRRCAPEAVARAPSPHSGHHPNHGTYMGVRNRRQPWYGISAGPGVALGARGCAAKRATTRR
ncbi:hypothetical protein C8T65DRAFT_127226 [Cerioporus squamosus]|nr:hypothetical protein C8T65DRAFT_127226 [Cerioporus squamosus]